MRWSLLRLLSIWDALFEQLKCQATYLWNVNPTWTKKKKKATERLFLFKKERKKKNHQTEQVIRLE